MFKNCLSRFNTADKKKKIESKARLSKNSLKAGKGAPLESDRGLFSKVASRIPRPAQTKDLNQRIFEAEQQLQDVGNQNQSLEEEIAVEEELKEKDNFLTDEEDSQTDRNIFTMVEKKQMILPGTRDAPKFSASKPKELRRFIRQLEDLWKEAGIDSPEERKQGLGKYADQESEEEWRALDTYGVGHSWEEFKKEILENYPEASAAERGTPARIRQIVREAEGIEMGDTTKLYAYRRAFLAEANKLKKPPAVMSNRELVELFMGGLSLNLGQAVLQYLGGMKRSKKKEKEREGESETERRPEDRYDLEEVCRAAGEVSENAQGMLSYRWTSAVGSQGQKRGSSLVQSSSTTGAEPSNFSNKLESLEESQALEKDRLDAVNKQWGARFDGLENMIKNLLTQSQEKPSSTFIQSAGQGSGGHFHSDNMSGRGNKISSGNTDIICYGCGVPGHFQNNCEKVKGLVQSGAIIYNRDGRVCLPDGSRVPNIPPGANLADRVEKYYGTMRPTQAFYGAFEEMEERMSGTLPKESSYVNKEVEDREQKLARLEKGLELMERESALLARQLKLENKLPEKVDVRNFLLEQFDEELKALQENRPGFH